MEARLHDIDEQALITHLKRGDEKGYQLLYDSYAKVLFGVVFKIVPNPEQASDILQEVFVKVWKNIHSFDADKGRLLTWALRIARNTAIDFTRSPAFAKKAQVDTQTFSNLQSEVPNINRIGVKEIVANLQPDLREIIDLMYFKGYTQAEVSKTLDLPLGTVKTRTRIAMRELKKWMN